MDVSRPWQVGTGLGEMEGERLKGELKGHPTYLTPHLNMISHVFFSPEKKDPK